MTTQTTTSTVHVPGYVERPYEQVCDLLEGWAGLRLSGGPSAKYLLGELSRVSRWSAHVPIERADENMPPCTVELRVLPVHTGHDALTELLLVSESPSPARARADRVERTRLLLDAVEREFDAAPSAADDPMLNRHQREPTPARDATARAS